MEFQLGQTYSGYEFLDIVNRSKDGIDYRVRNTTAGRIERLRALPETAHGDQERGERFLRETRLHAGLLHPNIVTLFHAFELEKQLVMTTELIEGPTLADRLQLGPLPWAEAVALMRQALLAVACAHEQQIVHRDINPGNIILPPGGPLKLANFALAKGLDSPKLTQVGAVLGNLKYISPEQIKGMGDLDARSDIYSLGMVLYEMLCGRPAFDLESQFELMAAHVNQAPAPPHWLNPAVPKALGEVVLKALAKDPADRYQSAAAFEQALAHAAEAPETVRVPQPEPPPAVPLPPETPAEGPAAPPSPAVFLVRAIVVGGVAGTCLGMLFAAIWLIVK